MYEVEVKVAADLARVRRRLKAAGADALGVVTQVDTYYDHPARSFATTDEALRIRREDGRATLTYKGPRVDPDSKSRREVETGLADADAAAATLEALSFEPVAEVHKTRERYRLGGYEVTLDDVTDVGEFVEVEAAGDADAVEPLRAGAYDLLERLDLDPDAGLRTSYLELLLRTDDGPAASDA